MPTSSLARAKQLVEEIERHGIDPRLVQISKLLVAIVESLDNRVVELERREEERTKSQM